MEELLTAERARAITDRVQREEYNRRVNKLLRRLIEEVRGAASAGQETFTLKMDVLHKFDEKQRRELHDKLTALGYRVGQNSKDIINVSW